MESLFSYGGEISSKSEIENSRNKVIFEGFQLSEYYFIKILFAKMVKICHEINKSLGRSEKKKKYKSSDFYTWFSVCVAKNIEGSLKIYTSYLVYKPDLPKFSSA